MSFPVYSYPGNPRVLPVLIAAELAGVAVEVPPSTMGTDNKSGSPPPSPAPLRAPPPRRGWRAPPRSTSPPWTPG